MISQKTSYRKLCVVVKVEVVFLKTIDQQGGQKMNSKLNVKNLVVAVLFLGMIVLAGCAAPKPPTTALDEQVMQCFQGRWESQVLHSGDVVTLTVIGQKVNVFSMLTSVHRDAHSTSLRPPYTGFETTYEINDGVISFHGRTGVMMKFWFREDGELVRTLGDSKK